MGVEKCQPAFQKLNLFVNTHPTELQGEGLVETLRELRTSFPEQPITLEIHEAAVTNPRLVGQLREFLSELDMRLAFDDFGAGQARLLELAEVRPDYLKFDMKLIQGIDRASPSRQQLVALLAKMVKELGIQSLAEGVETESEHNTLRQMGFALGQGFYYGRPCTLSKFTEDFLKPAS